MKRYSVLLTAGAELDLEAIYQHVLDADGPVAADRLLQRVLDAGGRVATQPDRGSYPKELLALGIREYRQLRLGRYRLIYRVIDRRVIITVIADGRRDMQSLLTRRLLRPE